MVDFAVLLEARAEAFATLNITPDQVIQLAAYLDHLWGRNRDMNLFSRKMDAPTLIDDHLFDSLIALPHLPQVATIADLGSGGGFPSIPIAICRPQTQVLLFEKSNLKCQFLGEMAQRHENLDVRGPLDPSQPFPEVDLVVARAFKSLSEILRFSRGHFQRGGAYFLYKGRRARIDEEIAEARINKVRIQPLTSLGQAKERHLVLIP